MPSRAGVSPGSDSDGLFKLPLTEFTAARNALAARLKKGGRGDEAERIKGLPKPSISAWAVNQLYWQHREAFDQLVSVGDRFRKAQASQLSGKSADLRGPLEARREALSSLTRLAADTLKGVGHSPTPDMMRRVTTTLEAISTYGSVAGAPPAGRLIDDVDPPGFETFAALVPRIGDSTRDDDAPTRVLPFRQDRPARGAARRPTGKPSEAEREEERKAHAAKMRVAVQQATRTLREARAGAERAESELKKAAGRTKDAENEKSDLEMRLERATTAFNDAKQQARRIAADAEQAAQDVADAERALEKATRDLEDLGRG